MLHTCCLHKRSCPRGKLHRDGILQRLIGEERSARDPLCQFCDYMDVNPFIRGV